MKHALIALVALPLLASTAVANTTPEQDREAYVSYFEKRFPNTPTADYVNGIYSIDAASREQWEAIEEFPPYEIALEEGDALYNTPFANGKGYSDCFGDDLAAVRGRYPYFDDDRGEVLTLELAINECREANGEDKVRYFKGDIAAISAYIAYAGRGNLIDVQVEGEAATAAYEAGRQLYYARKGQLNFACASCHVYGAGMNVRADRLSPGLGHTSHFPVYRSKWGEMGTLQRRFKGCLENIRAKPYAAQSPEFRNLEYFLAYMGNGLETNGPGARK